MNVATVSEGGGVLTITAVANGATALTITADDDGGTDTRDDFERTISVIVEGTISICDRTDEVEAAILAAISPSPACGNVTASQLAAITGTLNLSSMSISTLQSGDFEGFSGLTSVPSQTRKAA